MIAAYAHLRMVEHRLQIIDDQQTQTLPREGPELDHVAGFCGFASTAEFTETLLFHLGKVEDHYAELFEEAPSLSGPGSLVFTGTDDDPDTVRTLAAMGFKSEEHTSELQSLMRISYAVFCLKKITHMQLQCMIKLQEN